MYNIIYRCFFIHLGIAINIHPFIIQSVFRYTAKNILHLLDNDDNNNIENNGIKSSSSSLVKELLPTALQRGSFVDANILSFLWFKEFSDKRICIISGTNENPIFSTFTQQVC